MTAEGLGAAALKVPGTIEVQLMHHPDFRVNGKIFASLGYPDEGWGMVKLTPTQQRAFMKEAPGMFSPYAGAWGKAAPPAFISPRPGSGFLAKRSLPRRGISSRPKPDEPVIQTRIVPWRFAVSDAERCRHETGLQPLSCGVVGWFVRWNVETD